MPLPDAPEGTVVDRLLQRWREAPSSRAFVFRTNSGDIVVTRDDLVRRSRQWARLYQDSGMNPGDLVIVLIDYRPDMIFAYLGAMLAGCIPSYMPYSTAKQDPARYLRSHTDLFRRINAKAVVTVEAWLSDHGHVFDGETFRVFKVEDLTATARDTPAPSSVAAAPDDIALLQHSSGTTGLKKGVALSHRAILAQADAYARAIAICADDVIVSWLPLYHDMGLMACFILPLVNGTPVVMLDPFAWAREPQSLFAAIDAFRGTLCWLPNFAFHHLVRTCAGLGPYDLSGVRAFIDCSEPCKIETFDLFERTFAGMGVCRAQLQTCYAMAETTYAATQSRIGSVTRSVAVDAGILSTTGDVRHLPAEAGGTIFLSVGSPLEGTEIRILDDTGQAEAFGRSGEISIRSTSLFSGYFDLPEDTAGALSDGWYSTGDIGFLDEGELFITGRRKEMMIVRGRNFFAHDIEYIATVCPGVRAGRVAAIGIFNPSLGSEEVVVIAETAEPSAADGRKIALGIKTALDERMGLQVRSVHLVEPGWLVKTTSGKISRKENFLKYQDEAARRSRPAD